MQSQWSSHPQFWGIPRGSLVRYLGCQVGIDISPNMQVVMLLLKIELGEVIFGKMNLYSKSDSLGYNVAYHLMLDLF